MFKTFRNFNIPIFGRFFGLKSVEMKVLLFKVDMENKSYESNISDLHVWVRFWTSRKQFLKRSFYGLFLRAGGCQLMF